MTQRLRPHAEDASALAQYLWSHVEMAGPHDCWLWNGTEDRRGYGRIRCTTSKGIRGWVPAHRVAYELTTGPIPQGFCVCHSCDTPGCCSPNHLFAGTSLMNRMDCYAKRRTARGDTNGSHTHPESRPRGEKIWKSVLSEEQVLSVIALSRNGDLPTCRARAAVAVSYGVSSSAIENIVKGRTWRHLSTSFDYENQRKRLMIAIDQQAKRQGRLV